MFNNPFSFDGRIRRLEYGLSYIIYMVFILAITYLQEAFAEDNNIIGVLLMLFLCIPMVWFLLAQGAKRCHDVGSSGWFQIIPFYILYLIFGAGDIYRNEYGYNPKFPEPEDNDDIFPPYTPPKPIIGEPMRQSTLDTPINWTKSEDSNN